MVHKRPFADQDLYELACKHPRPLEYGDQLASFVEIVPCNVVHQKPLTSDEGGFSKSQVGERIIGDSITDLSTGAHRDFKTSAPGNISSLSWITSCTSEENSRSDVAVRVPFSPEYFNPHHPIRILAHSEEIYSSLLNFPPRKLVSVGPDHQADVPIWNSPTGKNATGYLDTYDGNVCIPRSCPSNHDVDCNSGERMEGNCVIPMPDCESSAYGDDKVGDGRTDCICLDQGSIRCVRQHVMEAREKLRRILGLEKFVELGFSDMGEEVACKWSVEEEQIFHEVVFSNPPSLGKNFWDHLSVAFPLRTKRDLVSYYFNVFMLRRRAGQNRSDPLNIDSDNDEWQESDDELVVSEEEDSVVESPVDQDEPFYTQENNGEEFLEDDNNGNESYETCDNNEIVSVGNDRVATREEDEEGIDQVAEEHIRESGDADEIRPEIQPPYKTPVNDGEDHDVQDDSCTSYECQTNEVGSCGPVDTGARQENRADDHVEHFHGSFDVLNERETHGYVFEPSCTKGWEVGYLASSKKEFDFLPTCMIEAVFGEEGWNNRSRDGQDTS